MDQIFTAYIPNVVNNPYALNTRRLIQQQGYLTLSIRKCLSNPRTFLKCKVFNFNWYDSADTPFEYLRKRLLLDFLHATGKKIIYTLHNKQPHNQTNNSYSVRLMKYMCRKADAIVGLCPDTQSVVRDLEPDTLKKLRVIPHPNYIGNYDLSKMESLRERYKIADTDMVFLFIGSISPYKNVELLIDTFKKIKQDHVFLIIAGNPSNDEYRDELLERMAGVPNLLCDFRYIPDDEIEKFYNTADIVILPYHKISSLNSGAVYLSFSLKKTVICPDIGTINALEDHSFVYDYHYVDEEEHAAQLEAAVFRACADYENNANTIRKKGERAYEYVSTRHSDALISKLYGELYRDLTR